jgi:hypothetical protein
MDALPGDTSRRRTGRHPEDPAVSRIIPTRKTKNLDLFLGLIFFSMIDNRAE